MSSFGRPAGEDIDGLVANDCASDDLMDRVLDLGRTSPALDPTLRNAARHLRPPSVGLPSSGGNRPEGKKHHSVRLRRCCAQVNGGVEATYETLSSLTR